MQFKLDKIARQASPLVLGRIASVALTFVLPLWLARVLDPAGFGTYKQLFLVAQTVLLICQIGLTQSLYYFLPGGEKERGAFVTHVLIGLSLLAVVAGSTLWLAAPWIGSRLGDGTLAHLRTPLALIAAGFLATAPIEAALTSEGRIGWAAACYVVGDSTRAAFLLLGALHNGVVGLAWGGVAYVLVRVIVLTLFLQNGVIPAARPSRDKLRRQLTYALPFAGSVLLYVAQKQFALYAVSAGFDASTFAMYSVALFHMPVVDILYTPITEVLMVRLGQARTADDRQASLAEWHDAVEKLATFLWPGAALAWVLGPDLLPLLFTNKYAASVPLFVLATIEIPLWVLPVDALLRATGDTRFLFVWNGVRAVLTAVIVVLGMRWFGIAGAVGGCIISEAISRAVMLVRGRRHIAEALPHMVDLRSLGRIAAAAAIAAAPSWLAGHLFHGKTRIIVGGVVYAAVYVGLSVGMYLWRHRADPRPAVGGIGIDGDADTIALDSDDMFAVESAFGADEVGRPVAGASSRA
jgi:O-antigen/teichoic acid export membrane protein